MANTNAGGQFYRANSNAALGGPARILVAPYSYLHAAKLVQIIDLATVNYPAQTATYGFVDVGATDKPTQMDFSATVQDWKNEQNGSFRVQPTDYAGKLTSSALEQTQQNKLNLMFGSMVTDPVVGVESRTDFSARDNFPIVHIAVLWMDQNNLIHGSVYPKCQWDGTAISQQIARGMAVPIPMNYRYFADDTLVNASTGKAVFRYDLDQYS